MPLLEPDPIVVAVLPHEGATVKRLRINKQGHYFLVPSNPDYDPILVDPAEHGENPIRARVIWGWTAF